MKTVDTDEFGHEVDSYLEIATAEPVCIEKTEKPFAVLLSYQEYERLKTMENAYWAEKASKAEAEGYVGESESLKYINSIASAET